MRSDGVPAQRTDERGGPRASAARRARPGGLVVCFLRPSCPAPRRGGSHAAPSSPRRGRATCGGRRPATRAIALVDGVFESVPSVWHHELLDALDAGVAVFGGASMGALRAAELAPHGMVGVGGVLGWYRDGLVRGDDEVALLHGGAKTGPPPSPCRCVTGTLDHKVGLHTDS